LCFLFCSTTCCNTPSLGSLSPHWHFSKDQAGDNLMVNGQDFRLDMTILSIQNSWWPLSLGWKWHYSCAHLTNGDKTELWLPYSSTNKPECSPSSEFTPQQKSMECCCSMITLDCTQQGAPQRSSYILDGQCVCIHL
jgi:hypothetical protein